MNILVMDLLDFFLEKELEDIEEKSSLFLKMILQNQSI
jgi:hypothetical protein